MGNHQEAIHAALKSVELPPKDEPSPGDFAIIAMSYSKLGETEKAKDYHERFHELMKLDAFKDDAECKSLSAEVERTFEDNSVHGLVRASQAMALKSIKLMRRAIANQRTANKSVKQQVM